MQGSAERSLGVPKCHRREEGKMPEPIKKISLYDKIFPFLVAGLVAFIQGVSGFYSICDAAPPGAFVLLGHLVLFWVVGEWFSTDSRKNQIE